MTYIKIKIFNLNQSGGNKNDPNDIEKKLIIKVFKKGNRFWYNDKCKLLLNSGNPKKAYNSILKYIKKKKKKIY